MAGGQPTEVNISSRGLDLIKKEEGLRLKEYIDAGGYLSIGYGHLLKGDERFEDGITKEEAEELLIADVADAVFVVDGMVTVPLTQNQFDALVSFVYNIGGDQFEKSTLLRLLNQGKYEEVPKQLMRWVKSNGKELAGLKRRRKREGELFAK